MEGKTINFSDSNIKSLFYNEKTKDMTVLFGGGSKWKYKNVEPEVVNTVLTAVGGFSILESIRHQNLVGVRLR